MGSDESHFYVSVGSDGQSHKTVSTNHNLFEEKGEPKRYRTEVLPLTSLTGSQIWVLSVWLIYVSSPSKFFFFFIFFFYNYSGPASTHSVKITVRFEGLGSAVAAGKDENTDAAAGSEVTCRGGNLKSVCVFGGGGGGGGGWWRYSWMGRAPSRTLKVKWRGHWSVKETPDIILVVGCYTELNWTASLPCSLAAPTKNSPLAETWFSVAETDGNVNNYGWPKDVVNQYLEPVWLVSTVNDVCPAPQRL